jgi:hypothetical protein
MQMRMMKQRLSARRRQLGPPVRPLEGRLHGGALFVGQMGY